MILIISKYDDEDAAQVCRRLRQHGIDFFRFDPADYPGRAGISLRFHDGKLTGELRKGTEVLDLSQVSVGWFRHPGKATAPETVNDPSTRRFIEEESRIFIDNLWQALTCRWLPGPRPRQRDAEFKLGQLRLAQSLGFELPDTLVSNEPEAFLHFYNSQAGTLVSKLLGWGLMLHLPGITRFTQCITSRDVMHYRDVKLCPAIFQEYVAKRVEIRATVVGDQVFAAEIHSQATNRTRHDWRRYNLSKTPHLPHTLPTDIAARCVALVHSLGLCFGAIDLVLTPENRYVFLEVNANGQWQWIEELTGLPINDAVCKLLIDMDRGPAQQLPLGASNTDRVQYEYLH